MLGRLGGLFFLCLLSLWERKGGDWGCGSGSLGDLDVDTREREGKKRLREIA